MKLNKTCLFDCDELSWSKAMHVFHQLVFLSLSLFLSVFLLLTSLILKPNFLMAFLTLRTFPAPIDTIRGQFRNHYVSIDRDNPIVLQIADMQTTVTLVEEEMPYHNQAE